jgi:NADH-quinone oxidoreductase subunit M
MSPLLWLFLIPLGASLASLSFSWFPPPLQKRLAIAMSFLPLVVLLSFHGSWTSQQVNFPWIPALSVNFHLEVDPLSLIFLYLTALIIPFSFFAVNGKKLSYPSLYYSLVLLLQGLLIGFFTARDLVVFTIFWEAMLLPLYFVISLWGGTARIAASIKFLIYMIAGSALMVAAVLSLYLSNWNTNQISSFGFEALSQGSESTPYAFWILGIFLLAFAVKTPLFPFHAWLPSAYYEAPFGGTILLAAILSKAGIYGMIRIGGDLFPSLIREWSPLMIGLGVTGVFYGGFAAWLQKDYKKLIAYSSFSHVNFIIVGLFVWNEASQSGAILQAVNHGVTITALFLAASWLDERLGTTLISEGGGLCKYMPKLCWFTLIFVLSNVALPGTNNFVGEFLILFGFFGTDPKFAAILALSVIVTAIYMLRLMQKIYFETPIPQKSNLVDMGRSEMVAAIPLVLLILWVGFYPSVILNEIQPPSVPAEEAR